MEFAGWTAPGYQPPDERVKYRYGLATDSAAKSRARGRPCSDAQGHDLIVAAPDPPRGVHALIEHLIETPADRGLIRTSPDELFERFDIPADVRETLRSGGRDDLHYLGIHPNLTIKWLAWPGRPTRPCFPIDYYYARR